jgi:NADH-quinone oxidoreductase subunit C
LSDLLIKLAEYVQSQLPQGVRGWNITHGQLTLEAPCDQIVPLLTFLRDDPLCMFKQLTDLAGVDYPERPARFEVVYHLLSFRYNRRVRVKVATNENSAVPSVTGIFSAAGWFEREAWDMYGILFSDNPDLRRILTDYGFDGHPQRRDFPLTGYVEMRYDEEQKRVVYQPVKLNQAYRSFDYLSPWEGPQYALPGDEKATKDGQ